MQVSTPGLQKRIESSHNTTIEQTGLYNSARKNTKELARVRVLVLFPLLHPKLLEHGMVVVSGLS